MPRVLITGAAGFIGMHTSIKFLEEGWEVCGLDNINDYYSVKLKFDRVQEITARALANHMQFRFIKNDLNSNVWSDLDLIEFDAVIHLAAQAGVRYSLVNPRAYLDSNILGYQRVIDFVERNNVGCFIYASSSSVYGKDSNQPFKESEACVSPESYYAATKKANELMAHAYFKTKGVKSIGLRFFTVYGPWGRPDMAPFLFLDAAFKGHTIRVFNHGNQKRDFTYVDDIVQGIYMSALNFHKVQGALCLNIGKGSPINLLDFIEQIESSSGKRLKKTFVEPQVGDVEITWADTTLLQDFIGYSPKIEIDNGVLNFVDWYKYYYKC